MHRCGVWVLQIYITMMVKPSPWSGVRELVHLQGHMQGLMRCSYLGGWLQ